MQIPVLIEPLTTGRYRARTGEPLSLSAEGATAGEATRELEHQVAQLLSKGTQLAFLTVPTSNTSQPNVLPFPADELYKKDPSFAEMQALIAEARRLEDEEEARRWQERTVP